jgi:class 3 adenylate cyclase/tetratricopeptide (TPR) repeat protein
MSVNEDSLQGTVTVLFTDVEDSTGLGTRSGDQTARLVLKAQEDLIRAKVAEHGGREIKSLGDGFMIGFSSARQAVSCAVEIQREFEEQRRAGNNGVPRVRMGLNAGEAIKERDDLFGAAITAAARISAKARGGEILISEVVKALIGTYPDATIRERGRFRLKGFEERWRLFEVVWRQETPSRARFERTPFVAREEERAELRAFLDRLDRGSGAVVMIGGEPGVGKTRIAEEIAAEARERGVRTLVGRCYEMDSPPPYLPFVELLEETSRQVDPKTFRTALGDAAGEVAKVMPQLRHMFHDIPAPLELPPEQERRYLFNSIRDFVARAAAARPLVVLLDDLQWADESSLLLLQHVAQTLEDLPVLILGTYRDVELDVHRPLATALESLVRRRLAHRMVLRRLSAEGVAAMLTKLKGEAPPDALVEAIHRETDGNPFFVEEVYRHLSEEGLLFDGEGGWRSDLDVAQLEVPEGVRLVVGRRLARLDEATRRALTAGAVIGRTFDYRVLEAMAEVGPEELLDAIDEGEHAGLVSSSSDGSDTRITFEHELIRHALLSAVALPRRQRLHLRVAEAIEKVYAGTAGDRASEIAHHFYQAGAAADPTATAHYLTVAGDRAMEAAAFQDALRSYEEALSLLPSDKEAERAELLFRLGSAHRSLGRLDEGIAPWREALAFYESVGAGEEVARLTTEIGTQLAWAARWSEAIEMVGRGLAAAGDEANSERVHLLGLAGIALAWIGQEEHAAGMIEEALSVARQIGDDRCLGEALTARCIHLYAYMRFPEALETGLQAGELFRSSGDLWSLATVLGFAMFSASFTLRFDQALEIGEELEPLAARVGHAGATMFFNRCTSLIRQIEHPDQEAAEEFARADLELCKRSQLPWTSQSHIFLGLAAFKRGDWDGALDHFDEARSTDPPSALWGWGLGNYFALRSLAGSDDARELIPEIRESLPRPGEAATLGRWMLGLFFIEGLAALGMKEEAARLYPLALTVLETGTALRFDARPVHTVAGIAAGAGADWHRAEEHFRSAFEQLDPFPDAFERHEANRFYAQMLLERNHPGDRDAALEVLNAARSGYARMGAARHEDIVVELLSRQDLASPLR